MGERLRLAMGLPCRSAAEHAPLSENIEAADRPETYYTPRSSTSLSLPATAARRSGCW